MIQRILRRHQNEFLSCQNRGNIQNQFTGYERDTETDLNFAQTRMYATRLERFTSVDPLTASATICNPQTLNRVTG
ncbi:MAG: hypothetical protein K1X52_13640 [Pyrinomonadaceae bacterium]|nr:hypothetical protein [Pyrinomonadaceae bacterium]